MTENAPLDSTTRSRGPVIAMPTNKVTVALPFSKITLAEPVQELAELTAIVAELAALVEAAGGRVVLVAGPPGNLKVTSPIDLVVAAALVDAWR